MKNPPAWFSAWQESYLVELDELSKQLDEIEHQRKQKVSAQEEYKSLLDRVEKLEQIVNDVVPNNHMFEFVDRRVWLCGTNSYVWINLDDHIHSDTLVKWLNSLPLKIDESANK